MAPTTLVIACGAIARELMGLVRANGWQHVEVQCLPAELHNRPRDIPGAVSRKLQAAKDRFRHVFVAYADCGTGGGLDRLLQPLGIERLPGAHCYAFFTGEQVFQQLADEEPGTFYLTDFLVRHFERLVVRGLGLDRHPGLRDMYFANYRRLVYLAQSRDSGLQDSARAHADYLGLSYQYRYTGLAALDAALASAAA